MINETDKNIVQIDPKTKRPIRSYGNMRLTEMKLFEMYNPYPKDFKPDDWAYLDEETLEKIKEREQKIKELLLEIEKEVISIESRYKPLTLEDAKRLNLLR